MNKTATIKIEARTEVKSKESKKLREKGYLPGSVFGKEMDPFAIKIKEEEFKKKLSKHGRNSLYNLDLDGQQTNGVMIKEIQRAPLLNNILSVSFQKVSLVDETKIDLNIRITGSDILDSKRLLLVRQIDTIPVKGLPQDIPDNIEIDVSGLVEGQKICVGDINFPKGITTDMEGSQVVLSVNASILTAEVEEEGEAEETVQESKEA